MVPARTARDMGSGGGGGFSTPTMAANRSWPPRRRKLAACSRFHRCPAGGARNREPKWEGAAVCALHAAHFVAQNSLASRGANFLACARWAARLTWLARFTFACSSSRLRRSGNNRYKATASEETGIQISIALKRTVDHQTFVSLAQIKPLARKAVKIYVFRARVCSLPVK